jgi:hypothetical protein
MLGYMNLLPQHQALQPPHPFDTNTAYLQLVNLRVFLELRWKYDKLTKCEDTEIMGSMENEATIGRKLGKTKAIDGSVKRLCLCANPATLWANQSSRP